MFLEIQMFQKTLYQMFLMFLEIQMFLMFLEIQMFQMYH
jgi:hypothetical protein